MTTLEELAYKHCKTRVCPAPHDYVFTLDQLRALIEEAVWIVQGMPVAYLPAGCWEDGMDELHHIDMERLK